MGMGIGSMVGCRERNRGGKKNGIELVRMQVIAERERYSKARVIVRAR